MALDKPRNTALPHANRPKVPTGSSMKRSASNESSMRRNLKRPALGDDIEEQDAIFRPWRDLSNPQDNINEEYEVYIELFFSPFSTAQPSHLFCYTYKFGNLISFDVEGLSEISPMKVYQTLSADPNSARAFLTCPVARLELWLKVKFGNEFFE
ncbi:hypothetical protein Cgig2_003464 [Carnegiea gigantea]|uniref:Uncharacterized protein n=1 Tax=Carnegiea gigantea TaxID=171969 RepID=A0A9Q1KBZ5_9CARY|nr:hypothetical protein Cgig2_003464 [Carnegiea gigantea]